MIIRELEETALREHVQTLKSYTSTILANHDVMIILDNVRKKVIEDKKRKIVEKKGYVADISSVIDIGTHQKFKTVGEITDLIKGRIEQEFLYVTPESDFDYFNVDTDYYVYGVKEMVEDESVYEQRMKKIEKVEEAIAAISKHMQSDVYEIELAALKKKYNKE